MLRRQTWGFKLALHVPETDMSEVQPKRIPSNQTHGPITGTTSSLPFQGNLNCIHLSFTTCPGCRGCHVNRPRITLSWFKTRLDSNSSRRYASQG